MKDMSWKTPKGHNSVENRYCAEDNKPRMMNENVGKSVELAW